MKSRSAPAQRRRLIRQLQAALHSLEAWEGLLRSAAVHAPALGRSDQPSETAMLMAIVHESKLGLGRRLAELGAPEPESLLQPALTASLGREGLPLTASPVTSTPKDAFSLGGYLAACRDYGRALGAAFRETQALADATSARILYGALRALEKQLWVLDPRQAY